MSFSTTSTVPIEMLPGIGKHTAKALRLLNIRTIGEFKRVPESILVELFGPSIKPVCRYVQNQAIRVTQSAVKNSWRRRVSKKVKVAALTLALL